MQKVLITGAGGLLGSNLCKYLLENVKDIFLIAIDNLSGSYLENIPIHQNLKFIKADLSNKNDQITITEYIEKELDGNVDYIIALAAVAWEGLSPFMRQYTYINNTVINAFLINCGIKYNIKRFVFTSSMAVYGHGDQNPPFNEEMIPCPIDTYGISKYACEMDLKIAYTQHNMEYCIIRPHNVFGENQNIWDPYRNVLGIWMNKALNDKPFTIYGDGEQTRAFTYIDNILPCLWKAAKSQNAKNEIINLGGIKHSSLNEAANILTKITKQENGITHLEPRHEVKHAWSSYQKSIDILDYTETVSLEDGLIKMWVWAKTQPKREQKYFEEYELDKGIYSYWKKK